jgi:hypothetical protein
MVVPMTKFLKGDEILCTFFFMGDGGYGLFFMDEFVRLFI